MKQRIDRLARLAAQAQQSTQPPSAVVEDLRIFDYGVGSVWLGRFDHDSLMANLAVLPEPTPAEEEVDRE